MLTRVLQARIWDRNAVTILRLNRGGDRQARLFFSRKSQMSAQCNSSDQGRAFSWQMQSSIVQAKY
jgi:hypothetical protein